MILIGIDPGESTGFAVYNTELSEFEVINTFKGFYECMLSVHAWQEYTGDIFVIVEDARLATYKRHGKAQAARAQGAGDVKGICREWERALNYTGIPHRLTRPNKQLNRSAKDADNFKLLTGYVGRTSHHARIAGKLALQESRRMELLAREIPNRPVIPTPSNN